MTLLVTCYNLKKAVSGLTVERQVQFSHLFCNCMEQGSNWKAQIYSACQGTEGLLLCSQWLV